MARDQIRKDILVKLRNFQEGQDDPVWVSGKQITNLFPKYNPSSVRMALTLLHDQGLIVRERRKGRGPKGKTGQSAWYTLGDKNYAARDEIDRIDDLLAKEETKEKTKTG